MKLCCFRCPTNHSGSLINWWFFNEARNDWQFMTWLPNSIYSLDTTTFKKTVGKSQLRVYKCVDPFSEKTYEVKIKVCKMSIKLLKVLCKGTQVQIFFKIQTDDDCQSYGVEFLYGLDSFPPSQPMEKPVLYGQFEGASIRYLGTYHQLDLPVQNMKFRVTLFEKSGNLIIHFFNHVISSKVI